MPRRVLDVGYSTGNELNSISECSIRLLEPWERLSKPVPYAALSYCWGSDLEGIVKTTKSNQNAHFRSIAVQTLPKSIMDAVLVSRRLCIRYLWVDALCIIQDDEEDWLRESAQMRLIYSNSHITIAAHPSASCKDGFLGEQEYGQPSWQRGVWTKAKSQQHDGKSNMRGKVYIRTGKPPPEAGRTHLPLEYRGWTLQEAVLPRRILHYTGLEMMWECNTQHLCECGHVQVSRTLGDRAPMAKTAFHRKGEVGGSKKGQLQWSVEDGWMRLVERYSKRKLSRGSDKLIAISGLVQMVGAMMHNSDPAARVQEPSLLSSIYLAGIFLTGFPRHLLWNAEGLNKRPPPHEPPYRAPTWSWASTDVPIEYPHDLSYKETSHVQIHHDESFCVPLVPGDFSGAVVAGELSIEGPVVMVSFVARGGPNGIVRERSGRGYPFNYDVSREVGLRRGTMNCACWAGGHEGGWCENCGFERGQWIEPQFGCLKVATYVPGSHPLKNTFFLVLEKSKAVLGAWERIGLGQYVRSGEKEDTLTLFRDAKVEKIRIL